MKTNSTMTKMGRLLKWAFLNGGLAVLVWLAVNGNEGASRLLVFVASVCGVAQFITGFNEELREDARKRLKSRVVPACLSHGLGVGMAFFLVWHGWLWTGVVFLLAELGEFRIYEEDEQRAA